MLLLTLQMAKRITIQDLAKELNTTASTISRALHNHPGISEAMTIRVKALAQKRNYRVNAMASNLRAGKSKTLGVIVPMINRDFFANVISGVESVAFKNGFNVIICQSDNKSDKEAQHIDTLISSGVAGVLVSLGFETTDFSHFDKLTQLGIPLIFFDRAPDHDKSIKIINNDKIGAYKATLHLIEMGYKRIAHFSGPEHLQLYKDRKEGYIDALLEKGMQVDKKIIVSQKLTKVSGYEAMKKLIALKNPPDAVFSSSDYAALGALLYLKEKQIKIPEQVGLVGFSNEGFTILTGPELSSVDQHGKEIGKYSAKVFFEEISSEDFIPRTIILDPKLIIRGSSLRKQNNK